MGAQMVIDGIPAPPEKSEQLALTPTQLLAVALNNNAAIDVIERLAALQEKAMIRDAEIQFNEAMNAAQSEIGRIAPDAHNKHTNSDWATYAKLDSVLRPIYIKHGLALSFDSGDCSVLDSVVAYCYVSHRGGHTRKYQSPPMPKPTKGPKGDSVMTSTHGTGAAMSYAMRYLLRYIFNLAIGEDDTDGNAMTGADVDALDEWISTIEDSGSFEELQQKFTEAYRANHNQTARDALIAAKDRRKKVLLAIARGQ